MEFANYNGTRLKASPGGQAACPACGGEVGAKCGRIKIWHWAHKAKDCDPWHESETAWHRGWKSLIPEDQQEVVIGSHRADIVSAGGGVVELQHSTISAIDIQEREKFYGKMVWLIDAAPFAKNLYFTDERKYWSFRWSYPRPHHGYFRAPVFWDVEEHSRIRLQELEELSSDSRFTAQNFERNFGTEKRNLDKIINHPIFHVQKIDVRPLAHGWGYWLTKEDFINHYMVRKVPK